MFYASAVTANEVYVKKFIKIGRLSLTYQMGLEKIVESVNHTWALWRIEEDEQTLSAMVYPIEKISETVTNPTKRLEWLAGRVLVKALLEHMNLPFHGITKDNFGKPSPAQHALELSLSHSFPYVAAIIDKQYATGIDLEQPKDKLLRIAHRIHHTSELHDAGNDVVKHCIYWCAKEALIKVYGRKDLTLAENLRIDAFTLEKEGDIVGRIIVNGEETVVPLQYMVNPDFVVVLSNR